VVLHDRLVIFSFRSALGLFGLSVEMQPIEEAQQHREQPPHFLSIVLLPLRPALLGVLSASSVQAQRCSRNGEKQTPQRLKK
jgi:hypothetical protein